ncbi:ankyrin repeat domain-containing protein [Ralstonia pseudosolanacearum]|uniref:ankyrin repeat domain-containing protein n=1 Tax=Ralstonia pseudosolanacearum TaxID=1310165 RepID=UPI002004E473|nr:ankyrin repeat domain-containing protein [Ralstonia pseudosolanacearum]
MLHLASFANRCDDIEELVKAGADVNAIGDLELRPLHYGVLGGNSDAVHLLLLRVANKTKSSNAGG